MNVSKKFKIETSIIKLVSVAWHVAAQFTSKISLFVSRAKRQRVE